MSHCTNCSALLPGDARFCPRCGTAVAAAPPPEPAPAPMPVPAVPAATPAATPAAPPAPPARAAAPAQGPAVPPFPPRAQPRPAAGNGGGRWWIAPAVVISLVLVGWLVVTAMPFGGREVERPREGSAATETVAEGGPAAQSGTLVEGPGAADDSFSITTASPVTTAPAVPPRSTPPAAAVPAPSTASTPSPAMPPSTPRPPAESGRVSGTAPREAHAISSSDAVSRVRGYVTSRRVYGVASECVRIEPRGYRNAGYNLEVWHACPGSGGSSRLLGRWRVDANTGEVFQQRSDGRYLRP